MSNGPRERSLKDSEIDKSMETSLSCRSFGLNDSWSLGLLVPPAPVEFELPPTPALPAALVLPAALTVDTRQSLSKKQARRIRRERGGYYSPCLECSRECGTVRDGARTA